MNQGEVWLIDLDPTRGAEIKKTRPAIIVNDNSLGKLPLKIIVPVTDWKDRYDIAPWMVKIEPAVTNGLAKPSVADCFQIRSVSQDRLIKNLVTLIVISSKKSKTRFLKYCPSETSIVIFLYTIIAVEVCCHYSFGGSSFFLPPSATLDSFIPLRLHSLGQV